MKHLKEFIKSFFRGGESFDCYLLNKEFDMEGACERSQFSSPQSYSGWMVLGKVA